MEGRLALHKEQGESFRILNLTDPQLGADEWQEGHQNRRILEETVTELINRCKPNLITVSGDISWAGQDEGYDRFADFIESFGIPWAPVWGNHDNQNGPEFIAGVVSRYMTYDHCVYEEGNPSLGNGNYVITIEEKGRPVTALLMMDTHDRMPWTNGDGVEELAWAKLLPEQLEWYKEQIKGLKEQGFKDAAAIMHIPIFAYRKASESPDRVGEQNEPISCYPEDEGAYEALKNEGLTTHVIAGHDHVNNWMASLDGIRMIYSLKAGAGCYWDPRLNGGTVLVVGENGICDVYHEYVDVSGIVDAKSE